MGVRLIQILDQEDGYLKRDTKLDMLMIGSADDGGGWYQVHFTKDEVGESLFYAFGKEIEKVTK